MMYTTRYDLILNMLLCATDMFILMKLMCRMYGPIPRYKKTAVAVAALALLFLLLVLPAPYENGFLTLPVSFCVLGFYPKKFKKKLLFESCLFTIVFSYLFLFNDMTNILTKHDMWIMWQLIVYHIGLWLLLFLCLKLCQTSDEQLPLSLWGILLFIPVTTLVCSGFLLFLLKYSRLERPIPDFMHLFIQTIFLLINLALFDLFRRFSNYHQKEREKSLLEQQVKFQEQHYKELMQKNARVKEIRHDMKNHLRAMSLLYEQGSQKELLEYIRMTTAEIQRTELAVTSGNPYIDALLTMKLGEMEEKGILCKPKLSIPQNLQLQFSDVVVLLGNILDNAIAACKEWGGEKKVELSILYQQHALLIHMENPCRDRIKKPYGTGMRNVARETEKYWGTLQTCLEDHVYVTDIVLYNLV